VVGWMKKHWSISIVILILSSFTSTPAVTKNLVGTMVGHYEIGITEMTDQQNPNIVNVSLSIGVNGVNSGSPYYNCGMTERLTTVKCQIPEQDYEESHDLDRTLMYSILGGEYEPQYGRWYIFLILLLVEFTIDLQSRDTQVAFTLETETDIIDLSANSSEVATMTESVSFIYRVHARYTNTMMSPTLLTSGASILGIGITVLLIVIAARRILPDKFERNLEN
jgi:hypothetical protein